MALLTYLGVLIGCIILLLVVIDLLMRRRLNRAKLVDKEAAQKAIVTATDSAITIPSVIPYTANPPILTFARLISMLTVGETKPDAIRIQEVVQGQIKKGNKLKLTQSLFLSFHFITTWDPNHFKIVLGKDSDYHKLKNFISSFKPLFDKSVASVEGDEWKRQRQIMNPSFQFEQVKNMISGFTDVILKLASKWENLANSSTTPTRLELMPWFNKMTLDVIGKAGFGFDFCAVDGKLNEEYNCYMQILSEFTNGLRLIPLYEKLGTERNKKYQAACDSFIKFLNRITEEKKKAPKEEGTHTDLLEMLVQAHSSDDAAIKLTDTELMNNLFIFFLAGHETTSNTLTFTVGLLAKYPEIQEKARAEVDQVTSDNNGKPPTFDQIKKLTYINAIIKESMRLFPTAFGVSRIAGKNCVLSGYTIPEGSLISLSTHAAHLDPDYWGEDVKEFKPERWLKKSTPHSNPFAYMPFGLGPRKCLGLNFAMLEMKICLCVLLQRFTFGKLDDFEFTERALTFQPQLKFAVNLSKRL